MQLGSKLSGPSWNRFKRSQCCAKMAIDELMSRTYMDGFEEHPIHSRQSKGWQAYGPSKKETFR